MEKITEETINLTREWFAENARKCAVQAISGEIKVNDLESYLISCKRRETEALTGDINNFAFWQRAHLIQTGECHSFFPEV